jgi:ribosomal protein S18 acetylase RimI-like enzyme
VVEIRRLASAEIDSVASVLALARLYQGDGFYLVAWRDNEPLGHLHLAVTDPPELQDVYVRTEHRRRGIATALTREAEKEARNRGFDRIQLGVGAQDGVAQAFYRRCGYVDAGVAPRHVKGTIAIRTGFIEVDETLVTWEKRFNRSAP